MLSQELLRVFKHGVSVLRSVSTEAASVLFEASLRCLMHQTWFPRLSLQFNALFPSDFAAEIGDFEESQCRSHLLNNNYIPDQMPLIDKIMEFHSRNM